ncbi:MAG: DUF4178 domain-containing protein [Bryobacteraceae bacterium]
MSSAFVSPPVVKPKSLSCPNCGGPVELRGFAHTLNVVCPQCLTLLDASTPELAILQTFQGKQRIQPLIPLGSRGSFSGTVFEAIGFQRRETDDSGWNEYVLFNPYKGFRYLSEYNGHWNFIRALTRIPEEVPSTGKKYVRLDGCRYTVFYTAQAKTVFVLGEFPWQVHVGEVVLAQDYIAVPRMLSSETTGEEVTWSLGEYWTAQQIWQAFRLPGSAPAASGIFANQPTPYLGKVYPAWRLWFQLMLALAVVALFFGVTAPRKEVFRQRYSFTAGMPGAAFVTSPFELTGSTSNLEIATHTDLSSNWAYFNLALINETTGTARDFGREISHYSDEGSPNDRVVIPNVSAGKYYLRVEPEMQAGQNSMNYELIVRHGVPAYGWLWLAALLLSIPPIFKGIRAAAFESRRWRESDYGSASK